MMKNEISLSRVPQACETKILLDPKSGIIHPSPAKNVPGNEAKKKEELILSCMPLVKRMARKYARNATDFDDLVQEGYLGLVEAAERFDSERGFKFSTFAMYRIRGRIVDALRKANAFGGGFGRKKGQISKEQVRLTRQFGREPKVQEVAEALQWNRKNVEDLMVAGFTQADENTLGVEQSTPEAIAIGTQRRKIVLEMLNTLPEDKKELIEFYYWSDFSLKEIGHQLGLSKSWTWRLLAGTLDRLRIVMQNKKLCVEAIT
jgi:RNA polymerase sigma factor FliA